MVANGSRAARFGGLCGVLYLVLVVPAYAIGYPEAPEPSSTGEGVFGYFGDPTSTFLLFNGVLNGIAYFFFLWFLGALYGVLRRAEGASGGGEGAGWISATALVGGAMFTALVSAGVAAEVVYPATVSRFLEFQPDAQFAFVTLALASWLYNLSFMGTAVLASATSMVGLRTGFLPRWLALAGFVMALLALLRFFLPLTANVAGLLWVAAISVFMLVVGGRLHEASTRSAS